MNFKSFLLVGLGSAIGGMLRYAIGTLGHYRNFPLATFCINVAGSFLIGLIVGLAGRQEGCMNYTNSPQLIFLTTGLCGGFTTFSAFSLENVRLLQSGNAATALLYTSASLAVGIFCCWLGLKITQ